MKIISALPRTGKPQKLGIYTTAEPEYEVRSGESSVLLSPTSTSPWNSSPSSAIHQYLETGRLHRNFKTLKPQERPVNITGTILSNLTRAHAAALRWQSWI